MKKRTTASRTRSALLLSATLLLTAPGSATCVSAADATESTEAATEAEYSMGTTDGTTYTNELFGFCFDADASVWQMATAEQLVQINGLTQERLSESSASALLENGTGVIEFYVQNLQNAGTVNLQVSKMGLTDTTAMILMNDQELVDSTLDQYLTQGYDQMIYDAIGLSDGTMGTSTVEFLGKEMPCLRITGTINVNNIAYDFYETMIFQRSGLYLGTITAAAFVEDTTAEFFSYFTEIQ